MSQQGEDMDIVISPELAGLATGYAERAINTMSGWSATLATALKREVKFQTKASHYAYAMGLINNYACLKTFFIRNEAVPLYNFYVPARIYSAKRKSSKSANFDDVIALSRCVVITGVGGAGKTIFMRHLLLSCLKQSDKIPVFIELRDIAETQGDLHGVVLSNLESNGLKIDRDFYDRLVKAGSIVYILDGFDEVRHESRKSIEKQISKLSKTTECSVIVSSRPDSRFQSWPNFSIAEISNLNLRDACRLIEKVPFDSGTKAKFIAELKSGLFAKHESLLSNPLLLSIMLLTYSESANIPSRITTFYQLAYEALFHRHDALKFGFERSRKTDLDVNQFSSLFSAFCLVTYDDRKFKFDHSYAVESTRRACRISNIPVDASAFVDDAREAICLFVEEGLELSFTHRSFQEYFAARFISSVAHEQQQKLIKKYSKNSQGNVSFDRVLELLYELNPQAVERTWLIPELSAVFVGKKRTNKVSLETWHSVIKKSFNTLKLNDHGISVDPESSFGLVNMLAFVAKNCVPKETWIAAFDSSETIQGDEFSKTWLERGVSEISVGAQSPRSQLMKDLSRVTASHSRVGLELIRKELLAMLSRADERNSELDSIFS